MMVISVVKQDSSFLLFKEAVTLMMYILCIKLDSISLYTGLCSYTNVAFNVKDIKMEYPLPGVAVRYQPLFRANQQV